MQGMYGHVDSGVDTNGVPTLRVMNVVDIKHVAEHELVLEWVSSVPNDMVADSTIALLLSIDSCPVSVKMTMQEHACGCSAAPRSAHDEHVMEVEQLSAVLEAHFGQVDVVDIGGAPEGETDSKDAQAADDDGENKSDAQPLAATIPGDRRPALHIVLDEDEAYIDLSTLVRLSFVLTDCLFTRRGSPTAARVPRGYGALDHAHARGHVPAHPRWIDHAVPRAAL